MLELRRGNHWRFRRMHDPRTLGRTCVKLEDSPHLLDGLPILVCAMVRWDDKFALRAVEV